MLNIAYAIVGAVFMLGMAVFAFLKGGSAERLGAGAYLFAWFATIIMQEGSGFRGVPIGVFLIDLALLFVFVGLSWRYRQSWPVWASGLQLIAVMSHIMILTGQPVMVGSLYTIMNFTGYLIILCLIFGTFFAWQERRAAEMNR
ncbi:hypothetical protein SH203_01180 [Brevundimonas sp. SH203]|uniref:hypothetical protein n=1 Tax=Brevundimonas sp. SH203 TaxID=345167 RepID=UPI0009D26968|nr:hypothetical protein [Brevundimonas sp. SH203]GAW40780.1 hypothetical protein SH203_01180 [Brevundimonas sp. SH203]